MFESVCFRSSGFPAVGGACCPCVPFGCVLGGFPRLVGVLVVRLLTALTVRGFRLPFVAFVRSSGLRCLLSLAVCPFGLCRLS